MLYDKSILIACTSTARADANIDNSYRNRKSETGKNRRKATHLTQPKMSLSDAILRSFNTWAFKREHPDNLELMRWVISDAITSDDKISFILYWGKGPRDDISTPDEECLDYLAALTQRISKVYENGTSITLIFTDTHARLNGYSSESIDSYFAGVKRLARNRDFGAAWLGNITELANLNNAIAPYSDTASHALSQHLISSAHKWYRGPGTPEDGALRYYRMNMAEKRAVELAFPKSIFITFNGSELRELFPDRLPIFYMYSLRRGNSVKPWFISDDEILNCHKGAG